MLITELGSGDDELYKLHNEEYGESGSGKLDGEVIDNDGKDGFKYPSVIGIAASFFGCVLAVLMCVILVCCCKR